MRFLSIAAGLSILLTLPAATLAQDNAAADSATESVTGSGTESDAETTQDTRPLAYAEEGISAGNALARSRNYLSQARQMANDDITADFADAQDTPAHAPLDVDDEIVLSAGPDPD